MRFESCVVMSLLAVFIRQDFVFLRSVIFWVVCATGFEVFNLGDLWQSWQSWQSSPIPVYQRSLIFFGTATKGFGFRSSPCLRHLRNLRRTVRSFQSRRSLAILAVLAIFSHSQYRLLLSPDHPILLVAWRFNY